MGNTKMMAHRQNIANIVLIGDILISNGFRYLVQNVKKYAVDVDLPLKSGKQGRERDVDLKAP